MTFDPLLDNRMKYRGLWIALASVAGAVIALFYFPSPLCFYSGGLAIAIGWGGGLVFLYDFRQESRRFAQARDEFNQKLLRRDRRDTDDVASN